MQRIALILALLVTLPAMAEVLVIDGSNNEAYERSVKAMVESLPDKDRETFSRGLVSLIFTRYPPMIGSKNLSALQFMGPAIEAAHITLDGVPLDEILAQGRKVIADDASRIEKLQRQSDEMERLRRSFNAPASTFTRDEIDQQACLGEKVIATNTNIEEAMLAGRVLQMDVTNNLPWSIASIHASYVVTSLGRSVPWMQDDFTRSIKGGIEPGETRKVTVLVHSLPTDAPVKLITDVTILDVADPKDRWLITATDATKGKSLLSCQASKSQDIAEQKLAVSGQVGQQTTDWLALSREDIKALQRALNTAGYDAGPADGIRGQRTKAALEAYQRENGFPVGKLRPETLEALGLR